jgi:hypothetical protein
LKWPPCVLCVDAFTEFHGIRDCHVALDYLDAPRNDDRVLLLRAALSAPLRETAFKETALFPLIVEFLPENLKKDPAVNRALMLYSPLLRVLLDIELSSRQTRNSM